MWDDETSEDSDDKLEGYRKMIFLMDQREFFLTKVLSTENEEEIKATPVEPGDENTRTELQEDDSEALGIVCTTVSPEHQSTHQSSGEIECPALTDQEKYTPVYGICSMSAKQNDIVANLHGCNVPVILREDKHELGFHTFIGCAYMAGYVNGEANGKFETRTFQMR
jgi:hypothetical protein